MVILMGGRCGNNEVVITSKKNEWTLDLNSHVSGTYHKLLIILNRIKAVDSCFGTRNVARKCLVYVSVLLLYHSGCRFSGDRDTDYRNTGDRFSGPGNMDRGGPGPMPGDNRSVTHEIL